MSRSTAIVGVIVVLASISIAVQSIRTARRQADQTQCVNNLKQLVMAVNNFHDNHKHFPLAIASSHFGPVPQKRTVDLPIEQCASWLFELHPYIEARMDPRFWIDINKPWEAEENRHVADSEFWSAQCPSASATSEMSSKVVSCYIAILGVGRDAGNLASHDLARGLFNFRHTATRTDVTDGISTTLALVETNFRNGRWIAGGFSTARGLNPEGPAYLGAGGQFASGHGRSTNVAMVDGAVRPLSDLTSASIFEALATIAGRDDVGELP